MSRVFVAPSSILRGRERASGFCTCEWWCVCIAHLGIMYLRAWAWVGQLAAGQAPSPELCSPQDLRGLESQPENLEQPFLSVFKKGRRRVPVRDLGKVVHYAKVQLRFQHSQDVSDCYLELFHSYLYFQARGSKGLAFQVGGSRQRGRPGVAGESSLLGGGYPCPPGSPSPPSLHVLWQGLLPLMELSVCPLEGSREHAFQITGPLPAPLHVLCPSQAELGHWLYHLEKQIALVRGPQLCHSVSLQGSPEGELPWTLQRRLIRLRAASGHRTAGSAVCASRVKLQHLPSQEQQDRLLVLYPSSLAIFSEEAEGLCFKGELPLSTIHVNLEEKEKQIRSFLIEGPLINTIRVLCASYEDYSHWLLCLQTISPRAGGAPSAGLPGLWGSTQVTGGGRGSLSSDGRTSWDSGCPAPPSTHTSHSLPESSVPPTTGCPARPVPDQADPGRTSTRRQRAELRRSSSSRSPRSEARTEEPSLATSLYLDLTKLSRQSLEDNPEAPDHSLKTPHSPLYADPYTPPATSYHKITDVQGLDEFLSAAQSSLGPESSSPFPSVPVSVPVSGPSSGLSGPHLLSKKGALQPRASQRHRGSVKGQGPLPPDSPQHAAPVQEVSPDPLPPPSGGHPPKSYGNFRDNASSPSHKRWPRGGPEPGGGLVQWI
ncbi:pleckstrin homology domain-containing family N member 1 isoform X3 [Mustela putorius furo]|uniref:Pleckstrin homology domain-containing family N member 1 isoform X3 n=1 Tax=Mustela putorius furo TaxID=9669 RepID=A0A8U0R8H3_MUSPF|nr:pleckstrin homology domain-containing family N member 1 isoform X3 [Mustela putorius furo]XP_044919383.1 pleckstrin homology domain-containing family N member 1 isoform X3 [Mustela putorius furo]